MQVPRRPEGVKRVVRASELTACEFALARDGERDKVRDRLAVNFGEVASIAREGSAEAEGGCRRVARLLGKLLGVVEAVDMKVASLNDEIGRLRDERAAASLDIAKRTKKEAWSPVDDEGEVARLRGLLADERAAHRHTKRSLETQILSRDSQFKKLQKWADDKCKLLDDDVTSRHLLRTSPAWGPTILSSLPPSSKKSSSPEVVEEEEVMSSREE